MQLGSSNLTYEYPMMKNHLFLGQKVDPSIAIICRQPVIETNDNYQDI